MSEKNGLTHIRVVYAELPPFVEIIGDDVESPGGFMPAIVKSIAIWMNLNTLPMICTTFNSLTWIREPEDKYGTWENDTWSGMCGMIFRNEVDVIVNPLLPSMEYAEVAYYTNPVLFESFTFLSGKKKEEGSLFLYFSVLEPLVWLSIGVSLITIAFTSTVLQQNIYFKNLGSWALSFCQILWIYLAYMLRQVPKVKKMLPIDKPRRTTLLLILITLWALGVAFLVMTVFQSLLVSKLTIVKSNPIVDSMQDFMDKSNVKGLTPREIELQEVLKDSGIPLYERTWEKLEPDLMSFEDVLSDQTFLQITKGKSVMVNGMIITQSALMDYFKEKGNCDMHLSNNYFFAFPLLMGLRKDLPNTFLRNFNKGLTRLIDADISGKWMKSIYSGSKLCTSYSENSLKPLQMKSIFGVLGIWAFGVGISFACFIVEILYFKSNSSIEFERYQGKTNNCRKIGKPSKIFKRKNIRMILSSEFSPRRRIDSSNYY